MVKGLLSSVFKKSEKYMAVSSDQVVQDKWNLRFAGKCVLFVNGERVVKLGEEKVKDLFLRKEHRYPVWGQ
jgi:hypothetical protein